MPALVFCSILGLVFAAVSVITAAPKTALAITQPALRVTVAVLLGMFFTLIAYAGFGHIAPFDGRAVVRIVTAFACGASICVLGMSWMAAFSYATSPRFAWIDFFRTINVPGYLILLLFFSGMIYARWFSGTP